MKKQALPVDVLSRCPGRHFTENGQCKACPSWQLDCARNLSRFQGQSVIGGAHATKGPCASLSTATVRCDRVCTRTYPSLAESALVRFLDQKLSAEPELCVSAPIRIIRGAASANTPNPSRRCAPSHLLPQGEKGMEP